MKNVQLVTWYDLMIEKMAKDIADEIDQELLKRLIELYDSNHL